ncbi:hypothetical protein NUH88_13310 [Nisaea acidiphila]|uniref:Tetratricopeptide repeat protein n=1 Tax=Nisaea acidiphila TaxID=1862145 RepID=A0A9J7AMJ7_9PROT|nr:tetratricopeptide repeat protein [Nisaea acidiphila]UUX48391.1 hypothetical protein NUH88_13310 [Nisaea acidiphila]
MKRGSESRSSSEENSVIPTVSNFSLIKVLSTAEAFLQNGQDEVAELLFDEALSRKPRSIRAHFGKGKIDITRGNFSQAEERFRIVQVVTPTFDAAASNIANLFSLTDRFEDAVRWYERAIRIAPEDRALKLALGINLLRLGDWERGFALYDLREDRERLVKTSGAENMWDGKRSVADKTVMVVGEQGFGDHINFARYCKLLKDRGAKTIYFTRSELTDLLERVPFIDEVATHGSKVRFDYAVMAMSLPGLLGTEPDSVPLREGYIPLSSQVPDRRESSKLGTPGPGPLRILIAWRGNPHNSRDAVRSCPFEIFADLVRDNPCAEFYCMPWDYEAIKERAPDNLQKLEGDFNSFSDTAEMLDQIDLVVSVDTSIVHLAGAIGKPTWLLIGSQPDWRWLSQGSDGIWYNSLRIFRPTGGWAQLVRTVAGELHELIARPTSARVTPGPGRTEDALNGS